MKILFFVGYVLRLETAESSPLNGGDDGWELLTLLTGVVSTVFSFSAVSVWPTATIFQCSWLSTFVKWLTVPPFM